MSGCSLGVEKALREGRAVRDQVFTIDPETHVARVEDPKIRQEEFAVQPGSPPVWTVARYSSCLTASPQGA